MSSVRRGQRKGERWMEGEGRRQGTNSTSESLGNRDEPYPLAAPWGQVTDLGDRKFCGPSR